MIAINEQKYFVIDFDSTITKVEGLDQLAAIALKENPNGKEIVDKIIHLTELGMSGKLSFSEALKQRISLLKANKTHLNSLVEFLKENISDSFKRNINFLNKYSDQILVVSSGFKEFILPITEILGIKSENVFANSFIFNENGDILGVDNTNVLSQTGGKIELLKSLKLEGHISVIGDGFTDYEIKKANLAK